MNYIKHLLARNFSENKHECRLSVRLNYFGKIDRELLKLNQPLAMRNFPRTRVYFQQSNAGSSGTIKIKTNDEED